MSSRHALSVDEFESPSGLLRRVKWAERSALLVCGGVALVALALFHAARSASTSIPLTNVLLTIGLGFMTGAVSVVATQSSLLRTTRSRGDERAARRRILGAVHRGRGADLDLELEERLQAPRLAAEAALLVRSRIATSVLLGLGAATIGAAVSARNLAWSDTLWLVAVAVVGGLWAAHTAGRYRQFRDYARRYGAFD